LASAAHGTIGGFTEYLSEELSEPEIVNDFETPLIRI
jgi:hypothetical protein